MHTPKILGICGALRAASTNHLALLESRRLFGPCDWSEADLRLPLYDGDVEAVGIPPGVTRLCEQIAAADGVIFASPEYNKAPPGVLKNALDWISVTKTAPWQGKPVAILSAAAGRSGGERTQYVLRWFMAPFQPRLIPGPEVTIAASHKAFDAQGQLTDAMTLDLLGKLMANLRHEIARGA